MAVLLSFAVVGGGEASPKAMEPHFLALLQRNVVLGVNRGR
jgi:hypothetical protein